MAIWYDEDRQKESTVYTLLIFKNCFSSFRQVERYLWGLSRHVVTFLRSPLDFFRPGRRVDLKK